MVNNVPYSAVDAISWLKRESKVGKTSYGTVAKNRPELETLYQ